MLSPKSFWISNSFGKTTEQIQLSRHRREMGDDATRVMTTSNIILFSSGKPNSEAKMITDTWHKQEQTEKKRTEEKKQIPNNHEKPIES